MKKSKITVFIALFLLSTVTFFLFTNNPGFARKIKRKNTGIKTVDAVTEKKWGEDAFSGCSLGCAINWKLKSSSSLPSSGGNTYSVNMLNDGKFKTAWVEGSKGDGVGEWVEYHLQKNTDGKVIKTNLWGLYIANGYMKNKDIWHKNSRVKQLRMDINGKPSNIINLKDSMLVQSVSFGNIDVKSGDIIRFTITKIYPGNKYKDTCITEMLPMGAH